MSALCRFGADTECLVRFSISIFRQNFRNLTPRTLPSMDVSFPTSDLKRARNRVLFLSTAGLHAAVRGVAHARRARHGDSRKARAERRGVLLAHRKCRADRLASPVAVRLLTDRFGGRTMRTASLLIAAAPCSPDESGRHFWRGADVLSGTAWPATRLPWAPPGTQPGAHANAWVWRSKPSVPATPARRMTKPIGPSLKSLVPAECALLGGLVPGGWRFVPVLYAALLVGMADCLSGSAVRGPNAHQGLASMVRADRSPRRRSLGAIRASGASASTTRSLSAQYVALSL